MEGKNYMENTMIQRSRDFKKHVKESKRHISVMKGLTFN